MGRCISFRMGTIAVENSKASLADRLSSLVSSRATRIGPNLFYMLDAETNVLSLCVSAVPPPVTGKYGKEEHSDQGLAAEIRYFKRSRVIELVARNSSGEPVANVELRLGDFLDLLGVSAADCALQ